MGDRILCLRNQRRVGVLNGDLGTVTAAHPDTGELTVAGVGVGIHYPVPVHLTDAYACLGYRAGQFPVAETAADRIMSLPMFPHLTAQQQEHVVELLRESMDSR